MSGWRRVEHCSESLIWSYLVIMFPCYLVIMFEKLTKNEMRYSYDSIQTLVKITRPAYRKTCLAIIGPISNKKLTKYEIRSSYCLHQFGFHLPLFDPKIPFLSIFRIAYLHLPLFTYIWPYLDLITPIWSYLPLIALILPYVPYSPNICIILLRKLFMEILHFKEQILGYTECRLAANTIVWVLSVKFQ